MKTKQFLSFIAIFLFNFSAFAQIEFSQIPDNQSFANNGKKITVKNNKLTQFYKEYNCLWEISYAKINGLGDTKTQDFLNDWLIGMTAFGVCEGDKEVCYDFISHHYFYKQTFVSFLQSDLLSFYTKEGNCRTAKDSCSQMMDWVIYDLKTKKIIRNEQLLVKEKESFLADLIVRKVHEKGMKLVKDWQAFDKEMGIETSVTNNSTKVIIYLYNDVIGNNIGLTLHFKEEEISPFIKPQLLNRIFPNRVKILANRY